MKKIVCLSGWGQKFNSLEKIFNDHYIDNVKIDSYDYLKHKSIDDFFADFSRNHQDLDVIIGWSLGGQLAIRLIANKIIKPKLLILISPPFQFVKDRRIRAAMPVKSYQDFLDNFKNSPNQTLRKFAILTILNDINGKNIIDNLVLEDAKKESLIYWLEELGQFSCFDIDFNNFPKTLYFHGDSDAIVYISQKDYFKDRIYDFKEVILSKTGHAPHLSNIKKIREYIYKNIIF